jgi:hypothetical protein
LCRVDTRKLCHIRCSMRKNKFEPNEIVVFDPKWRKDYLESVKWHLMDFKPGELVLFLGNIANVPGHCAVAKHDGRVIWMTHPEDFRKADEDEL